MYLCNAIDITTNACTQWVQLIDLFYLNDENKLLVIEILAGAVCFRLLVKSLWRL
jgi:hypothetical protein